MSNFSAMKQIGARNVGYKIGIMEWSNKMDLIAISNDKGEVIIYRLNWQKIWTYTPSHENIKVRAIAWRPDEKIIAIGYSDGSIIILDVENKEEIYTYCLKKDITTMSWTQNTSEINQNMDNNKRNILNGHLSFLPTLPNLNTLSSTPRKSDYNASKSCSKYILNFLVVCLQSGIVHLSVFGMLPCGSADISRHLNIPASEFNIIDAKLSVDFKCLHVIVKIDNHVQLLTFENEVLYKYSEPILNLAIIHYYIVNTLAYINDTIQSIVEAWETVLMEMDNKLTKYAESQVDGAVSADFLELLMFGHPSSDLQHFLTRELTEKGLKKLGNCIELSYSTIQKLVVKHLHSAILHIFYYLNCIKGMNKNVYYYEPLLGVLPNEMIRSAGAFIIKTSELQQTIDQSTRDYKIFFRWLYVAIIRLMDETVPDDIATVTQQEINYLAEFLNNFDKGQCEITANSRRFNLERVGQYIEDKELPNPIEIDVQHHWSILLAENDCIRQCPLIYYHNKKSSLIQEHKILNQTISNFFKKPEEKISNCFRLVKKIKMIDSASLNQENFTTHVNLENGVSLFAILESSSIVVLVEVYPEGRIKSARLQFQQHKLFDNKFSQFGDLSYRHIQYYNNNILSMLLDSNMNGKRTSYFVQFPISTVQDIFVEVSFTPACLAANESYQIIDIVKQSRVINIYDVLDPIWVRLIDNLDGYRISVSGNRKVASILSESCRRARFYEMEAEEDDDETDISQNTSLDNSKDSNL